MGGPVSDGFEGTVKALDYKILTMQYEAIRTSLKMMLARQLKGK